MLPSGGLFGKKKDKDKEKNEKDKENRDVNARDQSKNNSEVQENENEKSPPENKGRFKVSSTYTFHIHYAKRDSNQWVVVSNRNLVWIIICGMNLYKYLHLFVLKSKIYVFY